MNLPRSISDAAEFYQAEEELGLVKRQLKENKGEWYPVRVLYEGKNR